MSRRTAVVVAVVILVVLAVLLAWVRPWAGGGSGPAPTVAPPSAGSGAVTATGTPSSGVATVRLESLDGTLHVYDGEALTRELWAKMRDYRASDPAIALYLEWLRDALAPRPDKALNVSWYPKYYYWWFDDYKLWTAETPGNDTIVRVGVVKLPFGAGLIVTAYQAGDHVDIVVHGTIINETEWRRLVARSLLFHGLTYGPEGFYHTVFSFGESSRGLWTDWALWRLKLNAGGELAVNNTLIRVGHVYVLLEMPAYFVKSGSWIYLSGVEALYWMAVGHPALSLAVRLSTPIEFDAWSPGIVETLAVQIPRWLVGGCVEVPSEAMREGPYFGVVAFGPSAFEARTFSCGARVAATAMLASAMGGIVAVEGVVGAAEGSILVIPSSSPADYTGPVLLPIDIDGDGRYETGEVIAGRHVEVEKLEPWKKPWRVVLKPFGMMSPGWYALSFDDASIDEEDRRQHVLYASAVPYWSGVVEALYELPEWLRAPWLNSLPDALRPENAAREYMRYLVEWWYSPPVQPRSATPSKDPVEVAEYGLERVWFTRLYLVAPPDFWEEAFLVLLDMAAGPEDFVPPSVALALGKSLSSMPVVYEARTPELREYMPRELFKWLRWYEVPVFLKGVVEVFVPLTPAYVYQPSMWGDVPVFTVAQGTANVNGTLVGVSLGYDALFDTYTLSVAINGSVVYRKEYHSVPPVKELEYTQVIELEFTYEKVKYRVLAELPIPWINETLRVAELVPVDTVTVPTENGSVNVTVYKVNTTLTPSNETIAEATGLLVAVSGEVSRLGVRLDVGVFRVPPADYNVTATLVLPDGTERAVELKTWYQGYLHVVVKYPVGDVAYQHLLPEGTVLRITIQPLSLVIEVPIGGK